MNSSKPYFFRAVLEWIEDNDLTPHIIVDAEAQGVQVPVEYVRDGKIVLNISSSSVKIYNSNNEELSFSARFSGNLMDVYLPMDAIKAIFARENDAIGMFFSEEMDSVGIVEEASEMSVEPPHTPDPSAKNRSHLTVIK